MARSRRSTAQRGSVRVGMLDWGIGGLGCYQLLKRACPWVPVIYWSDTGAAPYGKLSRSVLTSRVESVLAALSQRGATHLVVACNAASTVLPQLRCTSSCSRADARASIPVMGIIEAARLALPSTLHGTLAVIGGQRTIRSGLHRKLLQHRRLRVASRIAQPLSAHIEAGTTHTPAYRADLARILRPLRNADALLLACTHYPAVLNDVRAEVSSKTLVLDPAIALVDEVLRRFGLTERLDRGADPHDRFFTTGSVKDMQRAAERAWGLRLRHCERVRLG